MKIIISEDSILGLKKHVDEKLPEFIYSALKKNDTSLGDSKAFPPNDEMGYAYSVIKERYLQVIKRIEERGYEDGSEEFLFNRLGKLTSMAIRIESGLKNQLEKLCIDYVNNVLNTPADTVTLKCKLVNKIQTKRPIRILPETTYGSDTYTFDDVEDIEFSNNAVAKRRFIDSLIQGISYDLTWNDADWMRSIESISKELPEIYSEMNDIDNYLLFKRKDEISDKNPLQNSFVEVKLGHGVEKTVIKSQGILFPYLLRETFRGFLELFSSHGLPNDNIRAMYVIKKADFVMAEPWDLRFGVILWDKIKSNSPLYDKSVVPYLFADICEMDYDEFNDSIKNFLAKTNKGKSLFDRLVRSVKRNREYNMFKNKLALKNKNYAMINDEYLTPDEIDKFTF